VTYRTVYILFITFFYITDISSAYAYSPETEPSLPEEITSLFQRHKIPLDSISLYIIDPLSKEPLLLFNEDTPRNPASTIKLLTTMAALEILGPSYVWQTDFYIDGKLDDGRLDGDLILKGGGDPFLSKENLWHILFSLQARGIRHIEGDLVIDDSLFEDESGSPADFDNKPYRVYNIFPDAALVNFNAQEFILIPDADKVHIYTDPPAANLHIDNKVKPAKGNCFANKKPLILHITHHADETVARFSGDYPVDCGEKNIIRSVLPQDEYIYGVFKSMWQQLGGTLSGSYRNASQQFSGDPFYSWQSLPLSEIIKDINKYSNNVMSRQLLLTMAMESRGIPGNRDSGIEAVKNWLESINIHAPELLIENGSGLSRKSRITAKHLGKLLEYAYQSPLQPEFMASFPLAGNDGTMRKRLNGDMPAGSARIKTGLLDDVRTMAGYIRSRNGREFIVIALQNYPGIHKQIGTEIQDEIIHWLFNQ